MVMIREECPALECPAISCDSSKKFFLQEPETLDSSKVVLFMEGAGGNYVG